MSRDLKAQLPDATCFSETNLLYMKNFYLLFPMAEFTPQLVEQTDRIDDDLITQQLVEQLGVDIFSIPWGHISRIIDKHKDNPDAALFFILYYQRQLESGIVQDENCTQCVEKSNSIQLRIITVSLRSFPDTCPIPARYLSEG